MSIMTELRQDFEHLGIFDNEDLAILCYLAATTRKMRQKLAITVAGESSTGKSTLVKTALSLIPPEEKLEISFVTRAALLRLNDIRHRVVAIHEHLDDPDLAQPFRLLSSEGEVR